MDSVIQNFDISAQNFNGHLVLDGYVATSEQKFRAAYVAEEVTGVRSVTNHRVVRKS